MPIWIGIGTAIMIDLETLAEIDATLTAMRKTESMLQAALELANLQVGSTTAARQAHLRNLIRTTNVY
jgi:hypothetical protein